MGKTYNAMHNAISLKTLVISRQFCQITETDTKIANLKTSIIGSVNGKIFIPTNQQVILMEFIFLHYLMGS